MEAERHEIVVTRAGGADSPDVVLEVEQRGQQGSAVVMVPSLGRALEDFDALAVALAEAGHRTIAVNPRAVGTSRGPREDLTLHDFAADIAALLHALDVDAAHLVGHAWGNRLARCVAADRPDAVRSVTLLAAGGLVEPEHAVMESLAAVFDAGLSTDERYTAMTEVFFAPGNDPEVWRVGWSSDAAALEGIAVALTDPDDWWSPPAHLPLLVVQGLDDVIARPENGRRLVTGREAARLVEIPGAGHALLPEQPEGVATAVIGFMSEIDGRVRP